MTTGNAVSIGASHLDMSFNPFVVNTVILRHTPVGLRSMADRAGAGSVAFRAVDAGRASAADIHPRVAVQVAVHHRRAVLGRPPQSRVGEVEREHQALALEA